MLKFNFERSYGRSTRYIVQVLYYALSSAKARVTYASTSVEIAKHHFTMALDIVPKHLIAEVNTKRRAITLINKAEIVFTSLTELDGNARGAERGYLRFDHDVCPDLEQLTYIKNRYDLIKEEF